MYVTTLKQLLFLLPLPTDYVQQDLPFFRYSQRLVYQSSEQMITCFIGRQTKPELENQLFGAAEKEPVAGGFN